MMRVSSKAVFISDSNRFGQGSFEKRLLKLIIYKLGLWKIGDFIKTKGRGYIITESDGLSYSYSVYDSYETLEKWAHKIIFIPTAESAVKSWLHPLITSSHILVCAIK